ncbi:MAG: acyl-CoA dehydrogenase family protein [Rhodospirillaceae bacterium]|nr:acyl-CoA dehydrogenase family protein [Rhodospirillaceae bacterium]
MTPSTAVAFNPRPTATPAVTEADMLDRARALGPRLATRADETERLRRLPETTVTDLHAGGFLKVLQPEMFGGLGLDWSTHVRLGVELARYCGATAWIQCVVGVHAWLAARLPLEGQRDIWGHGPDVLIATAIAGGLDSRVDHVSDGYVLSGRWRFASGIDHADWVILGAMPDDDQARKDHNWLELALPKTDVTVIDTWQSASLAGTGSNDVVVERVFVPTHRTVWRKAMRAGATPGSVAHDHDVHHVQFTPYFGSIVLGPVLGAAKGALEAYVGQTRARIGHMRGDAIARQVPVQTRLAESAAEVRAAAALVERTLTLLDTAARARRNVTKAEWTKMRADGAFAGRLCMSAADRLVKSMGAGGLTRDNPVRRFHADLMGMTAHISQQWDLNAAPFGAWALGVPTDNQEINAAPDGDDGLF